MALEIKNELQPQRRLRLGMVGGGPGGIYRGGTWRSSRPGSTIALSWWRRRYLPIRHGRERLRWTFILFLSVPTAVLRRWPRRKRPEKIALMPSPS